MATSTTPDPDLDPDVDGGADGGEGRSAGAGADANADQRDYWNSDDSREWVDARDRYDAMLAEFGERVLDAARPEPGERVLDVGCGNGATTLAAAALVEPGGEAVGIDLSAPMVANARARATERGLAHARFEVADAQTASLGGPYDAAISRFGVMFFDDPKAACTNIVGSLRSGGRVAFAVWRGGAENEWVAVQALAAAAHVPTIQAQLADDGPGPFRYADPAALVTELEAAGLNDVTADAFDTRLLLGGSGTLDEVMGFVSASSMTRRLLAEAEPEQRVRAFDAMREALVPFVTDDGVSLGAATWIVTGRRR